LSTFRWIIEYQNLIADSPTARLRADRGPNCCDLNDPELELGLYAPLVALAEARAAEADGSGSGAASDVEGEVVEAPEEVEAAMEVMEAVRRARRARRARRGRSGKGGKKGGRGRGRGRGKGKGKGRGKGRAGKANKWQTMGRRGPQARRG
jgi:hypothetical protein